MKKILILFLVLFFGGCYFSANKYTIIKKDNRYGLAVENKIVIKPVFKTIEPFNSNGYAIVKEFKNKYGVIDKNGNIILDTIYDSIGKMYNNRAIIRLNNKYGIVDKDYKIIVKPIYDGINDFINQITIIKQNNKFGCIDINGNIFKRYLNRLKILTN